MLGKRQEADSFERQGKGAAEHGLGCSGSREIPSFLLMEGILLFSKAAMSERNLPISVMANHFGTKCQLTAPVPSTRAQNSRHVHWARRAKRLLCMPGVLACTGCSSEQQAAPFQSRAHRYTAHLPRVLGMGTRLSVLLAQCAWPEVLAYTLGTSTISQGCSSSEQTQLTAPVPSTHAQSSGHEHWA